MDLTDNIKLMIGGRLDSFDITVDDIKNGTSESRTDDDFLQELVLYISLKMA